jgi:hypothetical protein
MVQMLATIGDGYHQVEVAVEVAIAKHAPFTLVVSVAFLSASGPALPRCSDAVDSSVVR